MDEKNKNVAKVFLIANSCQLGILCPSKIPYCVVEMDVFKLFFVYFFFFLFSKSNPAPVELSEILVVTEKKRPRRP